LVRVLENWKTIRGDLTYQAVPAALRALAAIGPAAKPALPAIEAVRKHEWPSPEPDPQTDEAAGRARPKVNISELAEKTRRAILGKSGADSGNRPKEDAPS
jgi:hypothetical protein